MSEYAVKPLGPDTWDAFGQLAERHNGVWNGCWCTWFHPSCAEKGKTTEGNRALKKRLVDDGRAHAALVFDGDLAASSSTGTTVAKGWPALRYVVPWA